MTKDNINQDNEEQPIIIEKEFNDPIKFLEYLDPLAQINDDTEKEERKRAGVFVQINDDTTEGKKENADDALSKLRNGRWSHKKDNSPGKELTDVLFRGQPGDYDLIPGVFRDDFLLVDSHDAYLDKSNSGLVKSLKFLLNREHGQLNKFYKACDNKGIALIGDSLNIRENFDNRIFQIDGVMTTYHFHWPSTSYLQHLIAAQHHGCKTRILDWTSQSFIAAYFAASEANKKSQELELKKEKLKQSVNSEKEVLKQDGKEKYIVVWALFDGNDEDKSHNSLQIVRNIPGSISQNLALQSGAITYHLIHCDHKEKEKIYNKKAINKVKESNVKLLYKVKLENTKDNITTLLFCLRKYGFRGSSLFKDFEGVKREMEFDDISWISKRDRSNA